MPSLRASTLPVLLLASAALVLGPSPSGAGQWDEWSSPEEAGFSSEALGQARDYWNGLDAAPVSALFVVFKGKVLMSEGRARENMPCHSVRKSFLSALYGPYVENGTIDLDATLEELGIDDSPDSLAQAEKQASVRHLLQSRSGVYIEAACERDEMKTSRPARGSHAPGTFWHYNIWDQNALGTIFRQETGVDIFRDFDRRIARRIGMQDFDAVRCTYDYEPASIHPCYSFRMSARDRARFGQLFLQNGRWGDREIIPEAWLDESTRGHSRTPFPGIEFGYMWWLCGPECVADHTPDDRLHALQILLTAGYGEQYILVVPDAELVFVTAVDFDSGGYLENEEMWSLLEQILVAREIVDLKISKVRGGSRTVRAGDSLRLKAKVKNLSRVDSLPTSVSFYLTSDRAVGHDAAWLADSSELTLAQRTKRRVKLSVSVPQGIPPGDYWLVAVVDNERHNYDLARGNNFAVWKKRTRVEE